MVKYRKCLFQLHVCNIFKTPQYMTLYRFMFMPLFI